MGEGKIPVLTQLIAIITVWVAMLFYSYIFTFNFIFMIKNHMVLLSQFTVRSY